jgi:hypothetical protein
MSCKKQKFYRVPSGYSHDHGTTAAYVIRFENEMGNDLKVSPEVLKRLETLPANSLEWATKTRKAAERYGDKEEVELVDLGCHPEIIAEDGDDGYLVLKG